MKYIIVDTLKRLHYADIVSSLALFISGIGLLWNIIKDFIIDKVSIEFYIAFGEVGNFKNSKTALFAEAGSIKPEHKFDNIGTLIKIINTGRRSIVVRGIGGELNSGEHISMAVEGLPKMLKPYEEFSSISDIRTSFMNVVRNNEIKKLWVEDTKSKKWPLSKEGLKKLKETADYINQSKHL